MSKISFENLVGAGVGTVDLVDDDDGSQVVGEGLAQDELGLRHGAFEGVDQQQSAIGHGEGALDFAAEVGVARGVDDVDLVVAVGQGDVLGEDGDAPLALQVVGVEDAVAQELAGSELAGLPQHRVDQGRLAVVDVGNDCYVADVVASGHGHSVKVRGGGRERREGVCGRATDRLAILGKSAPGNKPSRRA